jgi:hypothetical protein
MGATTSVIERESGDLNAAELADVRRVSRRLGWHEKKTYYHLSEGHFPPGIVVRVGRRVLFNMLELERWVLRGGQESRPAVSGRRRRDRPRKQKTNAPGGAARSVQKSDTINETSGRVTSSTSQQHPGGGRRRDVPES